MTDTTDTAAAPAPERKAGGRAGGLSSMLLPELK